ncbi:IdeS/Mac family cysteine endopeptidase [Treponema sp. Marseille-Q3903]|uniref:IdeS/Mac family cysteine endopeptidase n=1 Tax=Treponema sp. Marseille-Q3903 TaxID=2766703 RepID=UPI00165234A3|nr:IdeS/Mac family cysteine endopeptidase [Treponema sp. Marseille-Q3903]MBC6713061.1 Ig-like domain-containing protein [Treponema sp. Marseille-Q3903]
MKNKFFIFAMFAAIFLASCNIGPETPSVPVQDISITKHGTSLSLVNGTEYQIEAAVLPENATDKKISYSSSDKNIAAVNEKGLIFAKSVGTASITLKAADGVSKTISVTVTAARINVTEIAVPSTDENISIVKGRTHRLNATVKPDNATDKTLTYSSNHEDIASVDTNGLITAKKVGAAALTITAADGITKTVNVTVTEAEVAVTDIEFDPPLPAQPIELGVGQEYKINAKVKPDNATNKYVRITNNAPDYISVSGETVEGTKEGDAQVTVESASNSEVKKIIKFKIKQKPSIKIKTLPTVCESNGGEVTFKLETLNGKLNYKLDVVKGGSKWISFVSNDTSNPAEDTIKLNVSQNKTVWARTADIKFIDKSTNQYVKGDDKKDLTVKLEQKANENPTVITKWVHGVEKPNNGEKVPVLGEDGAPLQEGGQTLHYNSDYVSVWKENENTKFFNVRKLKFVMPATMTTYCYQGSDSNMCWAMTASNMLHWWGEQNKELINRYKNKYGSTYDFSYTKGLQDNKEYEKSKIAALFRSNCVNSGNEIRNGLEGFLFSSANSPFKRISSPKYFDKVFSKDNNIVNVETPHSKKEFERILKEAFNSKKAIGLDTHDGGGNLHAITLWGAAFDGDENIIAIYIADNNNPNNEMITYGIHYQKDIYEENEEENNYPYLINYAVKKSIINIDKWIDRITTLDKGETQWQAWSDSNP